MVKSNDFQITGHTQLIHTQISTKRHLDNRSNTDHIYNVLTKMSTGQTWSIHTQLFQMMFRLQVRHS